MLRVISVLLLPITVGVGAGGCRPVHVVCPGAMVPTAGQGLEPGDRVVARWRDAFYEATVFTVQDKLVTVAWDNPPPQRSYLPRAWIQSLDQPGKIGVGQWALCNTGGWQPCRIDRVEPEQGRVQITMAADAASQRLPHDKVLGLSKELREWVSERAAKQLKRTLLVKTINPTAPVTAGQVVAVGQAVLARWGGGSWWEATVRSLGDNQDTVVIAWADGSSEQTLAPTHVAPIANAPDVRPGDLAFCKWRGSTQWWQARIESVEGSHAVVIFQDGTTDQVARRLCLRGRQ